MRSKAEWAPLGNCVGFYGKMTRKVCEGCPVIGDCYSYAVVHQERGYWGGTSEDERSPSSLSVEIINALRSAFRSQDLLEGRDYLSVDQELVETQQPEHDAPIVHLVPSLDSSLDQSLEDSA